MINVAPPLKVEVKYHVCPFHEQNPGQPYAGCTCNTVYSARAKTWDEMTEKEKEETQRVYYNETF